MVLGGCCGSGRVGEGEGGGESLSSAPQERQCVEERGLLCEQYGQICIRVSSAVGGADGFVFAGFDFDVEGPAAFLFIDEGEGVRTCGEGVSVEGVALEVLSVEKDAQSSARFNGEICGLGDSVEFDVEGDGFLSAVAYADHALEGLIAVFADLDAVALLAFFEGDALGGESLAHLVEKKGCVAGFGGEVDHDFVGEGGWIGQGRSGDRVGLGCGGGYKDKEVKHQAKDRDKDPAKHRPKPCVGVASWAVTDRDHGGVLGVGRWRREGRGRGWRGANGAFSDGGACFGEGGTGGGFGGGLGGCGGLVLGGFLGLLESVIGSGGCLLGGVADGSGLILGPRAGVGGEGCILGVLIFLGLVGAWEVVCGAWRGFFGFLGGGVHQGFEAFLVLTEFFVKEVVHGLSEMAGVKDLLLVGDEEVLEIFLEFGGELIAIFDVLGESAHDDVFEGFGDVAVVVGGWDDLDVADLLEGGEFVGADKEALAGEHLVEQDASAEDIGASVDGFAHDLLGGHVAELSFEDAGFGVAAFGGGFGDPKVDDLHLAFVGEDDILGGDIAVNDIEIALGEIFASVGVVESFADFGDDVGDEGDGEAFFDVSGAIDQAAYIASVDVFHGDKEGFADATEFVNLGDVGVMERDGDARFIDKHIGEFGVAGEVGEDAFDSDEAFDAFEAGDFGPKDFGHSADVEAVKQQIIAEAYGAMHLCLFAFLLAQELGLPMVWSVVCGWTHNDR